MCVVIFSFQEKDSRAHAIDFEDLGCSPLSNEVLPVFFALIGFGGVAGLM